MFDGRAKKLSLTNTRIDQNGHRRSCFFVEQIKQFIAAGRFNHDDRFSPERMLSQHFEVTRGELRKALVERTDPDRHGASRPSVMQKTRRTGNKASEP